jgi:hypothetical protein
MYCHHCGKQISDNAQFCSFCGKAILAKPAKTEPHYEYCEIVFDSKIGLFFMKSKLWAKATGPKGIYAAASENKWRNGLPTDLGALKNTQAACDRMIIQLQNEGWELMPYKGSEYWSYKFRRQVA